MTCLLVWAATAYVLGVVFFIHAGLRYREIEGADALPMVGVVALALAWPLLLVSLVIDGVADAVRQR